jgi:ABC-2 type transport system ATP-binding protein
MIDIQNLKKVFQDKVAVHDLSLTIKAGEVFAFLGPNGAGKTTTIKILAGLLRPTSGTALVGGYNLATDGLRARALMSYVPDEPYLYDKLTASEFLRMIGDLYGLPRPHLEKRIDAVADHFELHDFMDQLTESYSHGMKQRTVIAAALLHEPRVLVVDEPMVGLDPRSARTVKDTFRELSRAQGTTIFMSTHTLSVAEEVCDRVGILSQGRLVALGTLEEMRQMRTARASEGHNRLEDLFLDLTTGENGASEK